MVDDDADILRLVRYSLEESHFEVATAGSAAAAIEHVAENGLPHLAIVDIMMPETDGIELCQSLHEFSDLPVIMLTAVDEEQTTVDVIELGRRGSLFVTRPAIMHYMDKRADLEAASRDLFDVVSGGQVKIAVNHRYPLKHVSKAHAAIEQRRTTGSTILIPFAD